MDTWRLPVRLVSGGLVAGAQGWPSASPARRATEVVRFLMRTGSPELGFAPSRGIAGECCQALEQGAWYFDEVALSP